MGFLKTLIKDFKNRLGSLKTILLHFKKNNNNRTGKIEIQAVARRRGNGEKAVSVSLVSEKVGLGPLIWVHRAQFVGSCAQDKGLDQEHLIRTRNKLLRRNKTLPSMENIPEAST